MDYLIFKPFLALANSQIVVSFFRFFFFLFFKCKKIANLIWFHFCLPFTVKDI